MSAFNTNGSKFQKRERFNSDCAQKTTVSEENLITNNTIPINIDPKLVKYDLKSKFFF